MHTSLRAGLTGLAVAACGLLATGCGSEVAGPASADAPATTSVAYRSAAADERVTPLVPRADPDRTVAPSRRILALGGDPQSITFVARFADLDRLIEADAGDPRHVRVSFLQIEHDRLAGVRVGKKGRGCFAIDAPVADVDGARVGARLHVAAGFTGGKLEPWAGTTKVRAGAATIQELAEELGCGSSRVVRKR